MPHISASIDMSPFRRALEEAERKGDHAVTATLDDFASETIALAQRDVPVRTGNLRDSIHVLRKTHESITVGTTESYAKAIEQGTGKRPARPFLENNARLVAESVPDKLARHLQ